MRMCVALNLPDEVQIRDAMARVVLAGIVDKIGNADGGDITIPGTETVIGHWGFDVPMATEAAPDLEIVKLNPQ